VIHMNEVDPIIFSYFEPMLNKTVDVRKSMMNERDRKFMEEAQKDFIKDILVEGLEKEERHE